MNREGRCTTLEFLGKTYEVVDHPSTDSIILWGPNNKSFITWNQEGFEKFLVPNLLGPPTDLSDYAYALKSSGFEKVESEHQWEFVNDDFVRGQPELLEKIRDRHKIAFQAFHNWYCNQRKRNPRLMAMEKSLQIAMKKSLQRPRRTLMHSNLYYNQQKRDLRQMELEKSLHMAMAKSLQRAVDKTLATDLQDHCNV